MTTTTSEKAKMRLCMVLLKIFRDTCTRRVPGKTDHLLSWSTHLCKANPCSSDRRLPWIPDSHRAFQRLGQILWGAWAPRAAANDYAPQALAYLTLSERQCDSNCWTRGRRLHCTCQVHLLQLVAFFGAWPPSLALALPLPLTSPLLLFGADRNPLPR